jgi:hypothetical protein
MYISGHKFCILRGEASLKKCFERGRYQALPSHAVGKYAVFAIIAYVSLGSIYLFK